VPRKFLTNIDLANNALVNALHHPVSSDPSGLTSGQAGLVWFNTTTGKLMYWNGTTAIDATARASHTGTQLAATISDLASTVQAYTLNQFAAPTAAVSFNSQKITNLATPTVAADGANKGYVDTQVSALSSGLNLKGSVRVATSTNVSITSPGTTVDGVTLAANDVILLMGQTTASQNGPWVWTASGSALTRPSNWASGSTATPGAFWAVREGTNADLFVLLVTDGTVTIDTTSTSFIVRGSSSQASSSGFGTTVSGGQVNVNAGTGIVVPSSVGSSVSIDTTTVGRKITGVVPASSSGIFSISGAIVTINHALNNSAPRLTMRYYTSPGSGNTQGQLVEADEVASDANNLVVTLPAAPAANQYFVSILG
jgi:hypothetical protein